MACFRRKLSQRGPYRPRRQGCVAPEAPRPRRQREAGAREKTALLSFFTFGETGLTITFEGGGW